MSRYRPPQPRSSPHISQAGFERLQADLKSIWKRRAEVTLAVTAAAAEGDRSENAEYIYRKKELRELDRRIHYLQKRLPELQVIPPRAVSDANAGTDAGRIYFSALVALEHDNGTTLEVRLVGADEIDPARNCISIDSPMARALLGKQAGDDVTVQVAERSTRYGILSVIYADDL